MSVPDRGSTMHHHRCRSAAPQLASPFTKCHPAHEPRLLFPDVSPCTSSQATPTLNRVPSLAASAGCPRSSRHRAPRARCSPRRRSGSPRRALAESRFRHLGSAATAAALAGSDSGTQARAFPGFTCKRLPGWCLDSPASNAEHRLKPARM